MRLPQRHRKTTYRLGRKPGDAVDRDYLLAHEANQSRREQD
jgi:hypothetical protein